LHKIIFLRIIMARDVFIVKAVRTPVAKAGTPKRRGTLEFVRPDDLIALTIQGLLERVPNLPTDAIDDVVIGSAFPEAEQGFNIGRIAALRAGLPVTTTGMTVNRFCASGLQAIIAANDSIAMGRCGIAIAGGVESMTRIPMAGHQPFLNPALAGAQSSTYISMGMTAENVAREYKISREDQDAFAVESHRRAIAAQREDRFVDETVEISLNRVVYENGRAVERSVSLITDEGPRADTSPESLAKLKPAFTTTGSVTAGNASQISDGAAAVLLASEDAIKAHNLTPLARIISFATTGNDPALMGVAPINAIPKALNLAGLSHSDLGVIEINEAFASQSVAIIRTLGLNPTVVNPNGGAIALGHPLGCTGARIFTTALHEAQRKSARYFGVGMCIGGGQGAFAVAETLG
jgi:acetyl-CoA acyltransferase